MAEISVSAPASHFALLRARCLDRPISVWAGVAVEVGDTLTVRESSGQALTGSRLRCEVLRGCGADGGEVELRLVPGGRWPDA